MSGILPQYALVYLIGTLAFFLAGAIAVGNYRKTRGLTHYWLIIAGVTFLSMLWTGSFVVEGLGITVPLLYELRLPLAVASLLGYTITMVQAFVTDVVPEIL